MLSVDSLLSGRKEKTDSLLKSAARPTIQVGKTDKRGEKMNYETIKTARKAGEAISLKSLNAAITEQKQSVATVADKVARLTATIHADVTDPANKVKFVAVGEALQREMRRLSKLYGWRDKVLADQPIGDVEIPDTLPSDLSPADPDNGEHKPTDHLGD